jgi:hypothetical protein
VVDTYERKEGRGGRREERWKKGKKEWKERW